MSGWPETVPSSHATTVPFGGTPTTCSDTSDGGRVEDRTAERPQGRRQRRGSGPEDTGGRDVQLPDAGLHQLALSLAPAKSNGADDPAACSCRTSERPASPACSRRLTLSAKATTSAPTAAWSEPLPGDRHMRVFDRAGLQDVERLALRDGFFRVDQPHFGDAAAARQLVRKCRAERSGADDRNDRHQE